MILKASHHPVIYPFLKLYTLLKIRRNFNRVYIDGEFRDKQLPVLVVSNHCSWWDGFWVMYLNLKLFHRRFYFMMLEEQLKKHMFFNKAGGFSVRKGSRSVIETLNYTADLLNDKNNIVLMFPQGEIESVYNREICFGKGIEHVLRKLNRNLHMVFLVNLIDYFSHPKPGLYMYFREYKGNNYDTEALEREYREFYKSAIENNIRMKD